MSKEEIVPLIAQGGSASWFVGGVDEAQIARVEEMLGVCLPESYKWFLRQFGHGGIRDLAWRIGATLEDIRLRDAVESVRAQQGAHGLWEYAARPRASRWVTLDLLRSLSRLDEAGEWLSLEPRTPSGPTGQKSGGMSWRRKGNRQASEIQETVED